MGQPGTGELCGLSRLLPPPATPPPMASGGTASNPGSGTGRVTSKHPRDPKGVRGVGDPPLLLGSCQSPLVVVS